LEIATDLEALSRYAALVARLNEPVGDVRRGELQLITDRDEILKHMQEVGKSVGIMYEDQYAYLLRDPVLLPPKPGAPQPLRGTHIRVVYKNRVNDNPGIFTLTIDVKKRLVLNRAFRHSTRHWMLEGQGTIAKPGESREDSVARCIRQEIGRPLLGIEMLCDDFVSERGLVGDSVPMMLAIVGGDPVGGVEDTTVAGHVALAPETYEAALLEGRYNVDGVPHRLRDGYTISAFYFAKARKLLS
jgi:hypothetical protein